MKTPELLAHWSRLNSTIDRARDLSADAELMGHWGKYVCVLSAGFLENSLRILFALRASRKASKDVISYVAKSLERIQNPKAFKFVEIARSFDQDWGATVEDYLSEDSERRKNAIDSIMTNRHLIAHGRSSNISVAQVREHLRSVEQFIDFLEAGCT